MLSQYQIYHDIGKPFCKTYDIDTHKYHFHNHANISADTYSMVQDTNPIIEKLIRMDMDIHTIKADDIEKFSLNKEAISLLITGLCEINANANMFGGIESTSFKIKFKQINNRGKRLIKTLKKGK